MKLPENVAKKIIDGDIQKIMLESWLESVWWNDQNIKIDDPCVVRIFSDHYDDSIEIDVCQVKDIKQFMDEKITMQFINEILGSGCSRFWINFYDNDSKNKRKLAEVYCCSNGKEYKIFTANKKEV